MGPEGRLFNIRQRDGKIEKYARHFLGVARQSAMENTCLMVVFWGGLAEPFKSRMPYWVPEELLEDYINLALNLSGSAFRVELAAEPATVQKLTESAPEPASFREPTESAPEPAPFREPTESAPEPVPFREPTESAPEPAPFREPTESAPEPDPFRDPTESTPEPAPFQEPTQSAPFREPTQHMACCLLVPCAPMSIVCPLPSSYLIIVSVAPAVSPSLPSFVSLYSLLVSAVLCWSIVLRRECFVLTVHQSSACLFVFPLRGGFCSSLFYFIIKINYFLHLSPRPHTSWQFQNVFYSSEGKAEFSPSEIIWICTYLVHRKKIIICS